MKGLYKCSALPGPERMVIECIYNLTKNGQVSRPLIKRKKRCVCDITILLKQYPIYKIYIIDQH